MELTISLIISIISVVLAISTFVINRKDKSNKDVKEEQKQFDKHLLIEYRLGQIEKNVEKILNKLDAYDKEIDERVEKAIKNHILQYHNKD